MPKITYSRNSNAVWIDLRLEAGTGIAHSESIYDQGGTEVICDFDESERIIGFEILGAREGLLSELLAYPEWVLVPKDSVQVSVSAPEA